MTNVIYESNFSAKDTPEYFNTLNEAIAYTTEWADCTADFTPCVKKIIVVLDDFGQCVEHEEPECCWTMKNPYVADDCLEETNSNSDTDMDPELGDMFIDGHKILTESGFGLSFKDAKSFDEFSQLCRDLGIYTGQDLKRFADETDADDSNMLDKLRQYKADLGDDFEIVECSERKPITEATEIPSDDYYVITTTEGTTRYYIKKINFGFEDLPEEPYDWFTTDLSNAQLFSSAKMAGEYFVERKLADNVFALGPNNRRVRYYDYVKTPYECWLIDTGAMKESCERKPIPEGMTIEELVEEMEENEDTVECTWCNDLFDKSECRYEVGSGGVDGGLGWLCSRCEMAIKSRGETLTFREGNYWDFLDDDKK